ncbi:LysR family transcriptional regulator [Nonomuraea sp. H19]|uniref:LysR family transcriptional regulator n=1 Tax=Nonomuraea sp. H19 TaxID=3452206 RepID=UPI003F88CE15
MELELGAVRAFVAVAEDRYFGEAAIRLGISQQAVSKRIARLESDLGLTLFYRSRNGADLTEDGRAFLVHARALVGIADQAVELLRGRRRALRVDVLDTRLASIDLIRGFHQAVDGVEVDIVTSDGFRSARDALARGAVDAVLCRVPGPLDDMIDCVPVHLEPVHLLAGRGHRFAGRERVETAELAGATAWMPGNAEGSEWAEFYRLLGAAFGIRIDTSGPHFGYEHYVETIGSGGRIGFAGEGTRLPWHPDVVQIPITAPVPVYPWSLLRHRQNQHPALDLLTRHLVARRRPLDPAHQWLPDADHAAFTRDRARP